MSTPESALEQQLRALFGGLDTRADFDARLMARLRRESQAAVAERRTHARQRERLRYLQMRSRGRLMLRLAALDLLGILLLVVAARVVTWPALISLELLYTSQPYWPYIATLFAILVAAVPVLGMWAEQTRKPIRSL